MGAGAGPSHSPLFPPFCVEVDEDEDPMADVCFFFFDLLRFFLEDAKLLVGVASAAAVSERERERERERENINFGTRALGHDLFMQNRHRIHILCASLGHVTGTTNSIGQNQFYVSVHVRTCISDVSSGSLCGGRWVDGRGQLLPSIRVLSLLGQLLLLLTDLLWRERVQRSKCTGV